jgi:phosphate transport system substrate-binding protein
MLGLEESVADIALMSRQIVPYDTYGVWRRSHHSPIEFEIATGSFDVPEKTPAIAVLVHRDNPLAKLTLNQLDRIFGAARTGGWQGMEWHTEISRGPDEDLRTWGQLGLTGKWKDLPIHTYGPPGLYPGGMSYFQIRVMHGADTWAESLREYADPAEMMKAFDRDPLGIVYAGASFRNPSTKTVALSEGDGPFVTLSKAHVRDRTYPLSRSVYLYIAPDTPAGDLKPPSPLLKEFLLYIFSRQGREDVLRQSDYLCLPPDRLLVERAKVLALSDMHHD